MKPGLEHVVAHLKHFRVARLEAAAGNAAIPWSQKTRPAADDDEPWRLSEDDVEETLVAHRPAPLLFGLFTADQVMADFARAGILTRCRSLGYDDLRSELGGRDAFETRFSLLGRHPDLEAPHRLIDLRTHQCELVASSPLDGEEMRMRAILLDWISMADATRPLPADALPGQAHPGLGLFRPAYRLTMGYLRRTHFDAVVNVPEHFHNAVLYSRDFHFFDPARQGMLAALMADLMRHGLARASRALSPAVAAGVESTVEHVEERLTSTCVRWTPAEQIMPLSAPMMGYFQDPRYRAAVREARTRHRYVLTKPGDA